MDLAARISYFRFFTTVQIYEFHISKIIIRHFDGIFGPNIMISSQLACSFSWQSAAPVSHRSWVQIPYRPEFFFRSYFQLLFSVVFLAASISHVRFFITVQMYEFHISKIIIHHLDGIFEPNILTSSQLASQLSRQSAAPITQTSKT